MSAVEKMAAPDTSTIPGAWLVGGGEMGERVRSCDWANTPLGPVEQWPMSLKTAIRILLNSRYPMFVWWGKELINFYNDAYLPMLGKRHPDALGRPASEVWADVWPVVGPQTEIVLKEGSSTWNEELLLVMERNGFSEEAYFTFSYSPAPDDLGRIGGVFCAVTEDTQRVLGQRRVRVLRALAEQANQARTAEDACKIAANILAQDANDLPFTLLYLLNHNQRQADLVGIAGLDPGTAVFPSTVDLTNSAGLLPFDRVIKSGESLIVHDLSDKLGILLNGMKPEQAIVLPMAKPGQSTVAGFVAAGISPMLQFNDDYKGFMNLLAGQIATAVGNARAYEHEKKRAEAFAELDRAKTAFFSNVSHEFRTPLTLMLGPLEDCLATREALPSQEREKLEMAHRNGLRLLKLVNTLLDFSRIEAGRSHVSYEPTDLALMTAELASVFRSATERTGLRLIIDCPVLGEIVYVDREMWEKVVFNLLSNAFKFTFDGEIEVSVRQVGSAVEMAVRDTGIGIPVDEIPRLFERFHRVKGSRGRSYEGSGIGLALVQELVKLHGGSIRVASELNRGSTFSVTVPLGKDHLPANRIGAARTLSSTGLTGEAYLQEALYWLPDIQNPSQDLGLSPSLLSAAAVRGQSLEEGHHILLADDNADMREYVRRLLAPSYDVQTVADGEAALDAIHQRLPDLVVADVMMPKLDGFGLLNELRSNGRTAAIPVLLLSARSGEESRIEGLKAGADDYLVKPFSARELLARVTSQLNMARIRREAAETQRKLRLDAELLAAIVDSSDDAIISKNLDGVITSWNKSAERLFGYTAAEVVGQHITLIIPADRRKEEEMILSRLRSGERIDHFETVRQRKDGTHVDVSLTISPVKDWTGRVVGASKVARDVTERKRTERALRQSEERLRKLSETLEAEVQVRTSELEERNAHVLRQSEQLRELSRRLLQAQDEERRHIARELHDSAGQTLAVLGMNLSELAQAAQKIAPDFATQAEASQELVRQLHQEIRTTSYLLHPPLLDEIGLPAALSWYVDGLRDRSSLDIKLDISEEFERLPRELELVVFRLIQESLTNIHRHSGSKTALISVAREGKNICIRVQDEGTGISAERLAEIQTRGSGVGIRGMRERIQQFHGAMNIESNSEGTTIIATIPLPKPSVGENESGAKPLQATM
jgi:PAS domain S-box-containing protein